MRKKLPLPLALLLAMGVITIFIVPLWALLHTAHVSNAVQKPVAHQPDPTATLAPTATDDDMTPSPVVTNSPVVTTTVAAPTVSVTPGRPPVTVTFTPIANPGDFGLNTYQWSNPSGLYYSEPIWLIGHHFAPGEPVHFIWEYQQPAPYDLGTVTVSSDGTFDYETHAPSDTHISHVTIAAFAMVSKKWATLSMPVFPVVLPTPYNPPLGEPVHVSGGDFAGGERVSVLLNGAVVGTAITDVRGAYTLAFTVSTSTKVGTANLQVVGQTSGIHATATLFYVTFPVTISPTAGPVGTQVTLTGAYFSPSAQVSITWIDHWGFTYTPTYVQTTSSGMFTVSLTIPNCPSNSCSYDCAGNSCYYAITDMVTNVGLAEPFQVT